ncbi:DUF1622 domain-containing protein [Ruminococcaceae bacterium OttesenSCG-928-O06]|nr:DUF1622 domain-containing protein [Ruminococcaceae bacterium OttesenSCG-928-O06]
MPGFRFLPGGLPPQTLKRRAQSPRTREETVEKLAPILEVVTLCINLFAVLVLVAGVVLCAKNLLVAVTGSAPRADKLAGLQHTKIELGGFVLLGLEILIVADIIETIVNPSFEDILRLAAIVAIRTVISYFLGREVDGVNTSMEELENRRRAARK